RRARACRASRRRRAGLPRPRPAAPSIDAARRPRIRAQPRRRRGSGAGGVARRPQGSGAVRRALLASPMDLRHPFQLRADPRRPGGPLGPSLVAGRRSRQRARPRSRPVAAARSFPLAGPLVGAAEQMTCREFVELVTEYLEGALSLEDRTRFEHHLVFCTWCVDYLQQMRDTLRAAGRLRESDVPENAKEKLLRAFRQWKRGIP